MKMVGGGDGGGDTMPRCGLCDVTMTSYSCMKDHLLGQKHQQKVRTVPNARMQSPYISARDTVNICEIEIVRFYNAFEEFGQISDFCFTVSAKKKTNPKNGTRIYVKYDSKAAADRALASSKHAGLMVDGQAVCVEPSSPEGPLKQPAKKGKGQPSRSSANSVDHALVQTTLDQLVRTQGEDAALAWLAGQLLLTPEQHQHRVRLCLDLQSALRYRFRTCLVQAFGSSVSGLGIRGCDLDLYAYVDPHCPGSGLKPDADEKSKVRVVASLLRQNYDLCRDVIAIPHARVPIVKFRTPRLGGVQCDMSFKDPMSCQNSRLVGWLMKADPRVRPLTVSIRYWAKRRNLAGGDHHPCKMSSYCITLMVVTFLQQLEPPVLPSVDWCQAPIEELLIGPWNAAFASNAIWRSTNTTPASRLLRQFFRFYSEFPAELQALCPLRGAVVKRTELTDREAGRALARPDAWAAFCDLVAEGRVEPLAADAPLVLQDPIELNFNVARSYKQLGLNRFRQCCREAADMPLARLFDEQALPKAKKGSEEAAVAAAATMVSAAAAAAAASSRSRSTEKRSLETEGGRDGEPAARKAKRKLSTEDPGDGQVAEVSSSDGPRSAPDLLSLGGKTPSENGQKTASGGGSRSSSVPPSGAGGKSAIAVSQNGEAATPSVTADPEMVRRVLTDFDRPPSRVVSIPLESGEARRRPRSAAERARWAEAFARLLEEVFGTVLRFDCRAVTFAGLELTMEVVRGFRCAARLPSWNFRRQVTAQLVGRRPSLQLEAEVTERALSMAGGPAPSAAPLAEFSCYLVLEPDVMRLCLYEGEAQKAGKNCHPFLASYLPDLARKLDYVKMFGDRQPGQK